MNLLSTTTLVAAAFWSRPNISSRRHFTRAARSFDPPRDARSLASVAATVLGGLSAHRPARFSGSIRDSNERSSEAASPDISRDGAGRSATGGNLNRHRDVAACAGGGR